MATDMYGRPNAPASAYGVPTPVSYLPSRPIDYNIPVAAPSPSLLQVIGNAISSGGERLRSTAQSLGSVVPFPHGGAQPNPEPKPPVEGQRIAPMVGRDIPIKALINLQRKAESSGNYQALNRSKPGNTASGAYQYTDSTWNGYGGYAKAMLAPRAVQDRRFAEDVSRRAAKYNGDLFKSLAAHYLPAQANNPDLWSQPAKVKTKGGVVTVEPVAKYLQHVLKGTPYAKQLEAYLNGQ